MLCRGVTRRYPSCVNTAETGSGLVLCDAERTTDVSGLSNSLGYVERAKWGRGRPSPVKAFDSWQTTPRQAAHRGAKPRRSLTSLD